MFTLAHISDIHLGPMPKTAWTSLLSKRITGYINWQRNRASEFSPAILNNLAAHMKSAAPHHIAITGDLVNLALPEEIERAKRWLNSLGSGKEISVVCGNHDAYVRDMLELAIATWQDYIIGDDAHRVTNNNDFPVLRRRGPCSLVLVNTALPTKPFDATGLFDQSQAERLEKSLTEERDNCRIILIHHPPIANATKPSQRLIGDELFREVISRCGAELVLHGHTHKDTLEWIEGPSGRVPVICVPAGGQALGGRKPAAHYNWFEISSAEGGWQIELNKFGYRLGQPGIARLSEPLML